MFDWENKEFKVGDVIVIENWATKCSVTVTRVTKLHAICEIKRADGTEYTYKFKKNYSACGNGFILTPVPRIEWNTNKYTVITKDE